jgi:hypothetical protein
MCELKEKYSKFHDYDFSKFLYKNNDTKGIVVCPKHGDFLITPKKMLERNDGCSSCSGKKKLTLEVIQQRINDIHGVGKYIIKPNQDYKNNKTKVEVVCIHHGAWKACVGNLINLKQRCPICAGMMSKIEGELKDFVVELDSEIESGSFDFIPPYQIDVLSHKHKIAIEMNGLLFHSEYDKKKLDEYHLNKTKDCDDRGYDLLHIFEDEWNNNMDICKSIIAHKFSKSCKKLHARKCDIKYVDNDTCSLFLKLNNIHGADTHDLAIGLYSDHELISIITFSKKDNDNWIISRFSNLINHHCVGGFGKIFKYFVKNHTPNRVDCLVDKRLFNGMVFISNGFEKIVDIPIGYYLFNKHEMIRYTPEEFSKIETKYPKDLYYKIWDCGYHEFAWCKNEETQGSSAPWVSDLT